MTLGDPFEDSGVERARVDGAAIALRHNASLHLIQSTVRAILRVYGLGVGVGVPPAEDQKAVGERCCCRVAPRNLVQGFGFRVSGFVFRFSFFRVEDLWFMVYGLWFMV